MDPMRHYDPEKSAANMVNQMESMHWIPLPRKNLHRSHGNPPAGKASYKPGHRGGGKMRRRTGE